MKNSRIKNKKGFTLVEIIVSLAIFSAVLAVLGGIMVSGFNYFYETSSTDLNKRSVDELLDYVRGELLYATDVRVQDEKPNEDNWYSFSIIDGQLHQFIEHKDKESEDLNIFSNKAFYNNNSLKMTAKAYENSSRLDLKYILYDDKEELYTTRDTLELLNVKSVQTDAFADELVVGENELKIYYKKGKSIKQNDENNEGSSFQLNGTVHDEIYNINLTNYRGIFEENKNYRFEYGEIVYYNGKYWKYTNSWDNNKTPGTSQEWKCLDSAYLGDNKSAYEKGDIVIYDNCYFQKTVKTEGWEPNIKNTSYWKRLGTVDDKDVIEYVKNNTYSEVVIDNKYKTVFEVKALDFINWFEPNPSNVSVFDSNKSYKLGNVVKVKYKDYDDERLDYYRIYINVHGEGLKKAPGDPSSGWTLLDYRHDSGSTYLKDDIVWNYGTGLNDVYIQSTKDNFSGVGHSYNSSDWKILN